VRGRWDRIPPFARGLALIALIAAVVVFLSLEPVLAAIGGILQIAFFLAIAFFLFLVWRERRGDLEAWSDWNRRLFYGAIALAVLDVGLAIGLGFPAGIGALAFLVVLAACVYVLVRVWRIEHRY
jgi:predicted MFS family arabinose efflux permease